MAKFTPSQLRQAAKAAGSDPVVGEVVLAVKSLRLEQRVPGSKDEWEKIKVTAGDRAKVTKKRGSVVEAKMLDGSSKGKVVFFTKDQVVAEKALLNLEASHPMPAYLRLYAAKSRRTRARSLFLSLAQSDFEYARQEVAAEMSSVGQRCLDAAKAAEKAQDIKTLAAACTAFEKTCADAHKKPRS